MEIRRLPAVLAMASALAVAACVPRAEETQPVSTPTPTPAPAPQQVPSEPAPPTFSNWIDAPATPGTWRYAPVEGGTAAFFGEPNAGARFALQCRYSDRSVSLVRSGQATGPVTMRVRTETQDRVLTAQPSGAGSNSIFARVPASDSLLDAMAFSRGRFAVEVEGETPLYIPAWPEVTRIIEDCR